MRNTLAFVASVFAVSMGVLGACSSSSTTSGGTTDAGNGATDAPVSTDDAATSEGGSTVVQPMTWTYVPIAGAKCRDGSDTGVVVNLNPASTKLMIFMEGGGACFNSLTCGGNPSKYGPTEFAAAVTAAGAQGFDGQFDKTNTNTIMSRMDDKNPVKDWNMLYVPYCTGDVHGGQNPAGDVPGVGPQNFAGYNNVKLDLDYIKGLLPSTTDVLLTGMSGGGFGVVMNYDQVATAFGSVPVTMIDDSGPPMADPYLANCLQTQVATLWGLDKTVLLACGDDCQAEGGLDTANFGIDVMTHLGKKYPDRVLGLIEAEADLTIREFFAFGSSNCTGSPTNPPLPQTFTEGLVDIRTRMSFDAKFGSYYFNSTDHTSIEGQLDTRTTTPDGGTPTALSDWITQMLAGNVTQVGP